MKKFDSYSGLQEFMMEKVPQGSTVSVWNSAREEAKELYINSNISQLDGSGYIKKFNLISHA